VSHLLWVGTQLLVDGVDKEGRMESSGGKKLVLSRETLRELTDAEMRIVAGGATSAGCIVLNPATGCDNTGIICEYSERTCCFP
jgi:hypothetical protein